MAAAHDHLADQARARIGVVLREKWRLDALLGIGGMASVYAATHRNGKRAAVKVLHAHAALDPAVKARFLREGYVANRVGHSGTVSILDDDATEDGTAFLVMELLEGESVEDRRIASGGTLPLGDALTIADQTLEVLAAAHAKQIVHRDLKPGNLFLTREGVLKVLDFGIARLGEAVARTATTSFSSSMGTLGFMAPEQARGRWELVDGRTDLWSVGATLFTLLSGRFVHEGGQTSNEQMLEAMTKAAPKLASVVPDIPAEVAALVDSALSFEREDRWPEARAMQRALREAYQAVVGRPLTTAPRMMVVSMHDIEVSGVASAPTMPAVSGPSSGDALPRTATTASTKTPRARRFLLAAAVAGALGAAAVIAYGVGRARPVATGHDVAAVTSGGSALAAALVATSSAPAPSTSAAGVTSLADPPSASAAPTDLAPSSSAPRGRFPGKTHGIGGTSAPSATPTSTVDIFERRR
jgi:serine/threonine protein kinase